MGQSNSAPANRPSTSPQDVRQPQSSSQTRNVSQNRTDRSRNLRTVPTSQRSSAAYLTRTQISSRNSFERSQHDQNENNEHDQVIFESEARPLRNMGDLRMPEAPINHISATPLPRPRSVISRVAANIHHRYSTLSMDGRSSGGLWNDTEEEVEPSTTISRGGSVRRRLSSFSNLRRNSFINRNRTEGGRFSISRPILQPTASSLNPTFGAAEALRRAPTPGVPLDQIAEDESDTLRPVRRSRMTRFRQSISGPMDLFRNSFYNNQTPNRSSQRATDSSTADESDYLIPPLATQNHSLDMEEHTGRTSDLAERSNEPSSTSSGQDTLSSIQATEALAVRHPHYPSYEPYRRPRRSIGPGRTIPNLLRGRSSRMIRRDDETPLSRILQLAATAIAAQLSGNTDALANLESVGDDQLDGNLNAFVEELNNAPGAPGSVRDANTPPLNFWRVFRFDNITDGRHSSSTGTSDDARTVTLVVVGVRSVPSSTVVRENGFADGNTETVSGSPEPRATTGASPVLRSIPRLNRHRPFSNSGVSLGQARNIADIVDFGPQPWSTPQSESPPGPYPPPSTPSERMSLTQAGIPPHLIPPDNPRMSLSSWLRRRSVTPSIPPLQDHDMEATSSTEDLASSSASAHQSPTRRRRSDSEAARHPHLRRDDPRRHGFIGPSRDREAGTSPARSWLIYVIGTHLSEDSPILDMPNLFDLNANSYEDMLRLQELIGPVKPPTASEADIRAAGGLFVIRVRKADGALLAEAVSGQDTLELPIDATCIICQEKYAMQQAVRKLGKCPHIFHQGCVDTWLTQGKNSCPLCRHQGVETQQPSPSQDNRPSSNIQDSEIGRAI